MNFRGDQRGFIFSLDATLAVLVTLIVLAGVARVGSPGQVYEQHGYLRLERYANDALEVMELTGTMDNIKNFLARDENSNAESLAENELRKILPREVQFKLRIGSEDSPRLDNVYPTPGNHDKWQAKFENAGEIAVADRVLAFLYQLDQNNPCPKEGWHHFKDETWEAQTFVAGLTGNLTKVALYLLRDGSPGDLTIEIRNCVEAENKPGSTIWASVTTGDVTSEDGQEYEFTFTPPASVTAGTHYSIVLHENVDIGDGGKYKWAEGKNNPYPEGRRWHSPDGGESWKEGGPGQIHDFFFRTYVKGVSPENIIFDSITLYVWRGPGI